MKYVKDMGTVTIRDLRGEPIKKQACAACGAGKADAESMTVSHKDFLIDRLADAVFGRSTKEIFAAVEIRASIARGPQAGYWRFEDGHYELLLQATRQPSLQNDNGQVIPVGYRPAHALSLAPFLKAIEPTADGGTATSEPPLEVRAEAS